MAPSMPTGLIDPKFCCCAVPLVNAGIYAIISEQAILGIAVGVTVLTTPTAVGVVVPDFAKVIFAIVCIVVTLIQPIGFIGVLREKTKTFKVYAMMNALTVLAAFITAAALIAVSAAKHEEAVTTCQKKFFSTNSNSTSSGIGQDQLNSAQNSTLSDEGQTLCSPFAWADIGIMAGLWLLLLLTQLYFIFYTYSYSKSQVKDHKLYHSVYSENPEAFTMSILRSSRYNPGSIYNTNAGPHGVQDDAWDARPSMSMDSPGMERNGGYYDPSEERLAEGGPSGQQYGGEYYDQNAHGGYHDQGQGGAVEGYPPLGGGGYGGPSAPAYGHDQNRSGSMEFPNPYPGGQSGGYDQGGPPGGGGYDYSRTPPRGGHQEDYGYPNEPEEARSRDPSATPVQNRYSYGAGQAYGGGPGAGFEGDPGLQRPEGIQNHPGNHHG